MIFRQKDKLNQTIKPTGGTLVTGSFVALTTLGLIVLAGCNLNNPIPTTGYKEGILSMQVGSNYLPIDLNTNMKKQHKRIVVTGEMGIILPRTGHPYGTIKDKESGELYDVYGKDINLHRKLMEKLHSMYDVKKWPVDIRVSGFLEAPNFIRSYSENIITITDLDQVVQRE